jgi:hypothetical protein
MHTHTLAAAGWGLDGADFDRLGGDACDVGGGGSAGEECGDAGEARIVVRCTCAHVRDSDFRTHLTPLSLSRPATAPDSVGRGAITRRP